MTHSCCYALSIHSFFRKHTLHFARYVTLPAHSLHVPADLAAQLMEADLFAAGAPAQIVLASTSMHNDLVEIIVVAMRGIRVRGRLDVRTTNKVMRCVCGEAVLRYRQHQIQRTASLLLRPLGHFVWILSDVLGP